MKFPVQSREKSIRLDKIREQGLTPGIIYGSGVENTLVSVDHTSFVKLYKQAGENTVIDLELGGKIIPVLIHDIDYDARTHKLQHVDFLAINVKNVVNVSVPVEITGESPAVKSSLGTLNVMMNEIEMEVLPTEIPHSIIVDITGLEKINDSISIADIRSQLPASAQPISDDDATICMVSALRSESDDEDSPTEIDFESIEVEKKGKEDSSDETEE